jgi:hypothetical protein
MARANNATTHVDLTRLIGGKDGSLANINLLAAAHNCRQQLSGIDKFDNNQVRLGLSHRK